MKNSIKLSVAIGAILLIAFFINAIIFGGFNTDNLTPVIAQTVSASDQPSKNTFWVTEPQKDETDYVFSILENKEGLTPGDKMILVTTSQDEIGMVHKKYQHFHNGVKVDGSEFIVHLKNDSVKNTDGRIFRMPQINIHPTLTKEEALRQACKFIGAKKYIWQLDSTKSPIGELIIEPLHGSFNSPDFFLCWHFSITSVKPFSSQDIYIDAHNGKEVNRISNIHNIDKVGTAILLYNKTVQNITTDYSLINNANQYRLKESTRNIWTLNGLDNSLVNRSKAAEFLNSDNTWNDELFPSHIKKAATQVHWGLEKTYDYFLKQGLRSFDGKGASIKAYLNIDYVEGDIFNYKNSNAFWSGPPEYCFVFPDGGWFGDYIVGLDVVAHEYSHAIVDFTCNLKYQGESGAIDESFADINGTIVEFNTKSSGNWTIGEDSKVLRSLSNPKEYNQPTIFMDSKLWQNTTNQSDNGGVHTNSSIQNYFFFLLTNGKSSTNDLGKAYSVQGIGMDKAAKIALRTLLLNCTSSTDYVSVRKSWLNSASSLYGSNSAEYNMVNNGWFAVGVGPQPPVNVTATDGTYSDKVRISWATKTGEFYQVLRSTSSNNATAAVISNWLPSGYNFDDTSALPGTIYYYWVKAADNSSGSYASIFSASDKGNKIAAQNCSAASNLSASNINTTGARINFTLAGSLNSASLEFRNSNTSTWSSKSMALNNTYIDLTGLNSSTKYYFRIKTVCTNGATIYTGEYSFTTSATIASCAAASNLSASNVNTTGARINFTLPGSLNSASLEFRNSNTATWSSKSLATNSSYFDLVGLNSSTKFIYRVKTICSNGTSNYTAEYSFTTNATAVNTCGEATSLSASNISSTSARISYKLPTGLSSTAFEYRTLGASNWNSSIISSNSTYVDFTGLSKSTAYVVRIKTICSNGLSSYSSQLNFTTIGSVTTCSAASNLSASNITSTSARIFFTLPSGTSSAAFEYRTSGSTYWNSSIISSNSSYVDFTSLAKATTYVIRIKTVCSSNGLSSYSSNLIFTTTGTKSVSIYPGDPMIKNISSSSTEFSARCFPNPVQDKLFVEIIEGKDQIFDCRMLNMFGQPVFSEKFNGVQTLEIDVSRYTRGVYVVVISNLDSVKQFKIVLQ